jgi:hypothetical protein
MTMTMDHEPTEADEARRSRLAAHGVDVDVCPVLGIPLDWIESERDRTLTSAAVGIGSPPVASAARAFRPARHPRFAGGAWTSQLAHDFFRAGLTAAQLEAAAAFLRNHGSDPARWVRTHAPCAERSRVSARTAHSLAPHGSAVRPSRRVVNTSASRAPASVQGEPRRGRPAVSQARS